MKSYMEVEDMMDKINAEFLLFSFLIISNYRSDQH
jgi:hypothetical protein